MQVVTDGGSTLRQDPRPDTHAAHDPIHSANGSPRPLLTAAEFRARLGGIGERRWHELRAAGIVGAALELGPRAARWTEEDLAETIGRLPRRESLPEPPTLAAGRRRRIQRMKAGE